MIFCLSRWWNSSVIHLHVCAVILLEFISGINETICYRFISEIRCWRRQLAVGPLINNRSFGRKRPFRQLFRDISLIYRSAVDVMHMHYSNHCRPYCSRQNIVGQQQIHCCLEIGLCLAPGGSTMGCKYISFQRFNLNMYMQICEWTED